MINENKEVWIKKGYEIFSVHGQKGLKIEPLAKEVGKSKSSFYHHFADLDIFINFLLDYHIAQSYIIAEKEHKIKNIDPELINILIQHKSDLLFNRQLRINQHIASFAKTLEQSNKIIGDAFVNVWIKDVNLALSRKQTEGILALALENFYLQINEKNIQYEWLSSYFQNLKQISANLI